MSDPAHNALQDASLYDRDFARWAEEQGRKLRARATREVDWENVAEEIESLGRSDRYEIESRMEVPLLHVLKWRFQPDQRSNSWRASIHEQRIRIARRIAESPSLRRYPVEVLEGAYKIARPAAAAQMGLALEEMPEVSPLSAADLLDPDYLPE